MGCSVPPQMCSGAQPGFSPHASTRAPICVSGSRIRFIGRLLSERSPYRRLSNGSAASTPAIRRMPVPEFPQSMSRCGAAGRMAQPVSVKFCGASPGVTCAPICCMARRVLRQSSLQR